MANKKILKSHSALLIVFVLLSPICNKVLASETWQLVEGTRWQKTTENKDKGRVLAIAELKQLVSNGKAKQLCAAVKKFKADFPNSAGVDFDAFMAGEMLFVKGKLTKAVKSYDKFLDGYPLSSFYESALEREFEIATAFLNGQKIPVLGIFRVSGHKEGTKVMEHLADRAGDRPIAQRALVAVAKSYEARGKFFEAYQSWSDVSSRWPTGQVGREALLGMARSLYSGYRGPKYDLKTLVSAKAYYQEFKQRYLEYATQMDIDRILNGIEEQLAYKYYCIGEYYERTGSKQAATLYFQDVVDSWPKTAAAELAGKKIGKL